MKNKVFVYCVLLLLVERLFSTCLVVGLRTVSSRVGLNFRVIAFLDLIEMIAKPTNTMIQVALT